MRNYSNWGAEEDQETRRPSLFSFSGFIKAAKPHWGSILASSVIAGAVLFAASFLIRDTFQSNAVILSPKQDQSIGALLAGSGGGLSSLASGGLSAVSLKNPNEVYLSLLQSRTLDTEMVNQFDLKKYYRVKTEQDAIVALRKHTDTDINKGNVITISVQSHDPVLSSQMANAYVEKLHAMNTRLALTDSAQRRLFYQEQLDNEKVLLAQAETALQETQTKTGVILPAGQADMISRSISALRAQITEREAELESMRTFAAPENPDFMQLQAQIVSLKGKLEQLENSSKKQAPGDIEVPTAQLPKSALEYARRYREVQLHDQLYTLLLKQFEAAKIDEAKTAPMIEVVDKAIPAERSSGPYRWLIGMGGLFGAFVINLLWWAWQYIVAVLREEKEKALSV